MGQVATLLEVIQRRKLYGLTTYTTFINFKKAYDTILHEALLMKLRYIVIRGKTLSFIRSLYLNSRVAIRINKVFSEVFTLERGLYQGCPISPILFDIFINDILQGFEEFGIKIPGVKGH